MIHNATLAIRQLSDTRFHKVLVLGLGMTIAVFVGLFAATLMWVRDAALPDWGWLDWWDMREGLEGWIFDATAGIVFFIVMWLLFAPVATAFFSLFLDDVVDAVEDKHYPNVMATKRLGVAESLWIGAKFALLVIGLNVIALPFYVVLTFTTAFGGTALYLFLNAYLFGREYFELVVLRHLDETETAQARRENRGAVLGAGLLIVLNFMIPVLNLLAPILGAAAMTHLFHRDVRDNEGIGT